MDADEYTRIMRKGDCIFALGGAIFVAALLGLMMSLAFMLALPGGIAVMGIGAQIQYSAGERLKKDILTELRISNSRDRPLRVETPVHDKDADG